MSGTFIFCPNSRVVEEISPDELSISDMNGWTFAPKSKLPYRPQFKVLLSGLYWRLNSAGNALDLTTDPATNAGVLRAFYISNRLSQPFVFSHEYLGNLNCRFAKAVNIPKAEGNSNGLIPQFEVTLEHHDPSWT